MNMIFWRWCFLANEKQCYEVSKHSFRSPLLSFSLLAYPVFPPRSTPPLLISPHLSSSQLTNSPLPQDSTTHLQTPDLLTIITELSPKEQLLAQSFAMTAITLHYLLYCIYFSLPFILPRSTFSRINIQNSSLAGCEESDRDIATT